jgi:MoxR-like ATPase
MSARDDILQLQARMGESIVGQERMIERLLLGLLANGHLLVEGLPGLAKTRAIKSLARHLDARLSRVQFTPDLLPADITGSDIYVTDGGKGEFRFQAGPLFANLVLADEVNRSPAKVQAALLEAMEERQVTVGEGTYPLPEAQMDRFLMHVSVGYPQADAEAQIIRLARSEEDDGATANGPVDGAGARLSREVVFAARQAIHRVTVSEPVERYIVTLVQATRDAGRFDDDLKRWIQVGVSPRGSIGLDKVARAIAWLRGRDHVTPDDVQAVVHDVFRHRLILSYEAHAAAVAADAVIDRLLERVAVA